MFILPFFFYFYFLIQFSRPFKLRNNQSFLNRVSFRRRSPARTASTTLPNNTNIKSISSTTVNAVRSCIDTFSETASITPSPSIHLPHEGSSSGKIFFFFLEILKINLNIEFR